MKIKRLVLLSCLAGLLFLGGCYMPSGPYVTPVYPDCDPELLIVPSLVSPIQNGTVNSFTPTFEWASPGYTQSNGQKVLCKTSGFQVHLSTEPNFQDELGGKASGVPGFETLYTRTWSPANPLEPGREYWWSIVPISQSLFGPTSEVRTFFTGPSCQEGNLTAPLPLSPLNHWTVNNLASLQLYWWYPDSCLPDSYNVEISPIMQFDNSPLNDNTGSPVTHWKPTHALQDCTRYFWRVSAVKGNLTGQGSPVYTFRVNLTGTCAPETNAMLQGTVWEDQCAGPGPATPIPDTPPLGCVYKNGDELFTNQTYDPGEPGIPGVIVNLGLGPCPSTGLRAVPTWGDGKYDFYMLTPGTYCVNVDTKDPMTAQALLPGLFTFPNDAVGMASASRTITVSAGQDLTGVDFGWWYKYGNPWGSTNSGVFGEVWHDMCAYTPGNPIPNPLPPGCVLDQWGVVHADAVKQPDEPGIPGVIVDIGPGDCPSAGLATAITDVHGYYHFSDLQPGKYCLRIDPDHGSPNAAILLPGSWTYIPSGHEGMTFRAITLTAGATLPGQDFGWDFDNLPLPVTPTPSPTPTPAPAQFSPNSNAYCRVGPDIRYDVVTSAQSGQNFLILGKNLEDTWYFLQLSPGLRCWISKSVGQAAGDLSTLPVFYGPPLPTNTPIPPSCASHKDRATCSADLACNWAFTAVGPGVCKAK